MKALNSLLILSVLILGISCEFQDDFQDIKNEYSFYITGINESVTYVFNSANGRTAEAPDEVKNLTVLIVNELEEIVYETRYYHWDDHGVIPDSIFIPKLPEGVYNIYAVTADYYNYWYYEGCCGADSVNFKEDSVSNYGKLILEPYIVNEGPIYVGSESIKLTEENQHVIVEMENISSKITLASSENIHGWLEMGIKSKARGYYDFKTGTFIERDYLNYLYLYLGDSSMEKNFYVLPQTLKQVDLYYYGYTDNHHTYSPAITMDPPVPMEIGDAITFKIDIDAIMAGSGTAVFEWEDIDWNDLGVIPIP